MTLPHSLSPDLTRRRLLAAGGATALGTAAWPMAGCSTATTTASTPGDPSEPLPIRIDTDPGASRGVFFGVFREAGVMDVVDSAQEDYRFKPAAAMWFTRFGAPFPESAVRYLAEQGMAAQVTWEPWGARDEAIPLADIVAGKWDAYLAEYGAAAARLNLPFMLRWGHEFNGDWYPWGMARNGQSAALYVKAYRRVVERVRAAGASQVQWVWCFNNQSTPQAPWNDPALAWPGADVVDWVGIDGYNFGVSQPWSRWTPFREVFENALATAARIAPDKPVILAEMASSEAGGDKAAWIQSMFAQLPQWPQVRAFTWFDIIKETSWALTSSEAAWDAMVAGLRSEHVRGNGRALLAVARTA